MVNVQKQKLHGTGKTARNLVSDVLLRRVPQQMTNKTNKQNIFQNANGIHRAIKVDIMKDILSQSEQAKESLITYTADFTV